MFSVWGPQAALGDQKSPVGQLARQGNAQRDSAPSTMSAFMSPSEGLAAGACFFTTGIPRPCPLLVFASWIDLSPLKRDLVVGEEAKWG